MCSMSQMDFYHSTDLFVATLLIAVCYSVNNELPVDLVLLVGTLKVSMQSMRIP